MENGTCNRGYKCGRNVSKRVAKYELVTWTDNVIDKLYYIRWVVDVVVELVEKR